jgi:hypothetical protein
VGKGEVSVVFEPAATGNPTGSVFHAGLKHPGSGPTAVEKYL